MIKPIRCYYLEHGYDSRVGGPCCFQPIAGVTCFSDMQNNPEYQYIRQSFEKGNWPDGFCSTCKNLERLDQPGILSKRQSSLENLKYSEIGFMHYLSYNTGYLCNIQCRSCSPNLSSSWIKEFRQLPDSIVNKSSIGTILADTNLKVYPHIEYNYIFDDLSKLKSIQLLGGEPIYNPGVFEILEKIYQLTNGNCEICFVTNGTIPLNFEKNNWMSKFKTINIVLSLDAIGSGAEFIRTGSKWETIEKNIDLYKSISNVNLSYHPTFSVLNLFEINKLFNWCKDNGIHRSAEITCVEWPKYLSYQILTDLEKEYVVEYLKTLGIDFIIPKITQSEFSLTEREKFFKFMEHTTSYHNMSWEDYLPELYKLLNT